MSKANTERNNRIWEDKKVLSWSNLARKYLLTISTLRTIVMQETVRRLKEANK